MERTTDIQHTDMYTEVVTNKSTSLHNTETKNDSVRRIVSAIETQNASVPVAIKSPLGRLKGSIEGTDGITKYEIKACSLCLCYIIVMLTVLEIFGVVSPALHMSASFVSAMGRLEVCVSAIVSVFFKWVSSIFSAIYDEDSSFIIHFRICVSSVFYAAFLCATALCSLVTDIVYMLMVCVCLLFSAFMCASMEFFVLCACRLYAKDSMNLLGSKIRFN